MPGARRVVARCQVTMQADHEAELRIAVVEGLIREADARALRASLRLIEAEARPRPEERRSLAEQALDDFESALAQNPNLGARWRGRAALARELATLPR